MPPGQSTSPLISQDAIRRMLMQGGDPSSMFSGDPSQQPATPSLAPTPPASGTLAANMSPAAPPAPSTPTPSGTLSAAMTPPPSKADYLAANPVALPARPRGEFDKIPDGQPGADTWSNRHNDLRHGLASIFAGMQEFGRPGQGFETVNRWGKEEEAKRNYDQNQPVMKQQAENQQYSTALGQGQQAAEIGKTQVEAGTRFLPGQQKVLDQIRADKQAGKFPDDKSLFQAHLQDLQTTPGLTRQMLIDAINNTPTLGSKYTLTRDPQTQMPVELADRQGNHYSESNLPKDPEALQMWNDAKTAGGEKLSAEENKEKRVAGYAADRQAAAFGNQQTAEGRKAAQPHLNDINDAKNQQEMMEKLTSGKMNPASQTAAMFKMIGLEQPTGTHRIMPAEIEGIEQMGGLSDRLKQKLLNWKQGDRFSPDLVPDLMSTAKILTQNKIKTANDNLQSTFRNTGYKVPGTDANGRLDKPEDYQQPQQGGQGGGAQHTPGGQAQGLKEGATGTGSDGKKYIVKGGVWVSQ